MGREASSKPGRPPAYGRQGPCRWRSKGQRAKTAKRIDHRKWGPPRHPSELWLGLARTWSGWGTWVLRLPERLVSSRGKSRLETWAFRVRHPERKPSKLPSREPLFRVWTRRWRFFEKLKCKEVLGLFFVRLRGGYWGEEREPGDKKTAGSEKGGGARNPEHNFPGRLSEQRLSPLALKPWNLLRLPTLLSLDPDL